MYRAVIIADNPAAYWPLDDPVGSATLADVSGNGYNLTPNATGVTLSSPAAVYGMGGSIGVALDGSTGYLIAPAGLSSLIGAGASFSAEIWLTLTTGTNSGFNRVFSTDYPNTTPFDGWTGGVRNDGSNAFFDVGNGTVDTATSANISPAEAQLQPWHLVWVFSSGTMKIYSNGVQVASTTSPTLASGRFALNIGRSATGFGYLQATVQHAAIYGYPLSATQISNHYSAGLAGDAAQASPSLQAYKQQIVQVLSPSGAFIDVWRDAPLLAGVKFAVNSATQPLTVTLPRTFDDFDEGGTPGARGSIAQGNIVQYYLFGPGLPSTGLLKYQGVIDSYAPEIAENGEERVTVTITPFDSVVGDNGLTGGQSFGTPGSTGSYVDPITMFNWFFTNNDPVTSKHYTYPLTLDGTNPSTSGNTSQYTFGNQQLNSIFDTVTQMLPSNWFWRPNANKTVTLNVAATTAQHQFVIGQHIVAPSYKKDWTKLKNYAVVIGNGLNTTLTTALVNGTNYTTLAVKALPVALISGQKLALNENNNPTQTVTLSASAAKGATSVTVTSFTANDNYPIDTQVTILVQGTAQGSDLNTFGKRVIPLSDNRVVDQNTATILAQGLINVNDQMALRTKLRIVDYRGDAQSGIGYDIETILPGDTCQIVNPNNTAGQNLWDVVQWNVDYWDYSPVATLQQVVTIVSVTYNFDYVDLELANFQPSQDRDVLRLQIKFQDFSLA